MSNGHSSADGSGDNSKWAADDGPLGNLRYDSALMGAISSQRGQKVPSNKIPVSALPKQLPQLHA